MEGGTATTIKTAVVMAEQGALGMSGAVSGTLHASAVVFNPPSFPTRSTVFTERWLCANHYSRPRGNLRNKSDQVPVFVELPLQVGERNRKQNRYHFSC